METVLTSGEVRAIRNTPPVDRDHLWNWVYQFTGIKISRCKVCREHQPPFEWFADAWFDAPPLFLVHGPRGGSKSFLNALGTHLDSRFNPGFSTRILGGSLAQSHQVYEGLRKGVRLARGPLGSDADTIKKLLKTEGVYRNGSDVSILAASETSVRGPHVPRLRLDEVDVMPRDIRESSVGMAMEDSRLGYKTSISMTSTWHLANGPMAELMERGKAGEFPTYSFCVFDVLERCPVERSGAALEKCPACPIVKWCHADRHRHPRGLPKAKRSDGHYTIDSLIQKLPSVSPRVFESDYLSRGPKAEGLWFTKFDIGRHVTREAEYDPDYKVYVTIDSGPHTGALWFQIWEGSNGPNVNVFADFYSYDIGAEANARAILGICDQRCNGRMDVISTDPSGGSKNAIGPTVIGEYERVGLRPLHRWPKRPVLDGLTLVESFVMAADETVNLFIHPRCKRLVTAMLNYRRKSRNNQWMEAPEDPQHPFEEMVDALRGGLVLEFPEGRAARRPMRLMPASSL